MLRFSLIDMLFIKNYSMKRIAWVTIALCVMLTACASLTPVTQVNRSSPTPVATIYQSNSDVVVASAVVVPAQISNLGFNISALVKEIPVSKGDLVKAGQPLMVLNTPELEYAVVAAEQDYNSKSLAAELQKADKVLYVNPNNGNRRWYSLPKEVYLKALSEADQSKALWDSASASLAQGTLLVPFDGTVVDILVTPGETIQANQSVLVLADLSHLQFTTTDLSERDIVRVKLGQKVDIHVNALAETLTGKVIRIAPKAENVGGDIVFPVTIQLDQQPPGLLWGMTTEVEIHTK